ncbi:MAG: hypothetical protein V1824_03690 [archaeon]
MPKIIFNRKNIKKLDYKLYDSNFDKYNLPAAPPIVGRNIKKIKGAIPTYSTDVLYDKGHPGSRLYRIKKDYFRKKNKSLNLSSDDVKRLVMEKIYEKNKTELFKIFNTRGLSKIDYKKNLELKINFIIKEFGRYLNSSYASNVRWNESYAFNQKFEIKGDINIFKLYLGEKIESYFRALEKKLYKKYAKFMPALTTAELSSIEDFYNILSKSKLSITKDEYLLMSKSFCSNVFYGFSRFAKALDFDEMSFFLKFYENAMSKNYSTEEINLAFKENSRISAFFDPKTNRTYLRRIDRSPTSIVHELYHKLLNNNLLGDSEFLANYFSNLIAYSSGIKEVKMKNYDQFREDTLVSEFVNKEIFDFSKLIDRERSDTGKVTVSQEREYYFGTAAAIGIYHKYNGDREKIRNKLVKDLNTIVSNPAFEKHYALEFKF